MSSSVSVSGVVKVKLFYTSSLENYGGAIVFQAQSSGGSDVTMYFSRLDSNGSEVISLESGESYIPKITGMGSYPEYINMKYYDTPSGSPIFTSSTFDNYTVNQSITSASFSFTTYSADSTVDYTGVETVKLTDSYGDGWVSGSITFQAQSDGGTDVVVNNFSSGTELDISSLLENGETYIPRITSSGFTRSEVSLIYYNSSGTAVYTSSRFNNYSVNHDIDNATFTFGSASSSSSTPICFLKGSKVVMGDGSERDVCDVREGDVLKTQRGSAGVVKVLNLVCHNSGPAVPYRVGDVMMSGNHLVYVNGEMKRADSVGERVVMQDKYLRYYHFKTDGGVKDLLSVGGVWCESWDGHVYGEDLLRRSTFVLGGQNGEMHRMVVGGVRE